MTSTYSAFRAKKISSGIALVTALALAASPVAAISATATAPFLVKLTIIASCTISATPLDFGTASNGLSAPLQNTSTLSLSCSNSTPYQIGLNAGTVTGSSTSARLMAGTTAGNTATTVSFSLHQNSYTGANWGNISGTDTLGGVGNGIAQTVTLYGVVPAQATPAPDTYQTTVTATAYF